MLYILYYSPSDEFFYGPNEILIAQIDCSTIYPKKIQLKGQAYYN